MACNCTLFFTCNRSRVGAWVPSAPFLSEQRLFGEAVAQDVAVIREHIERARAVSASGVTGRGSRQATAAPLSTTGRVWRPAGESGDTAGTSSSSFVSPPHMPTLASGTLKRCCRKPALPDFLLSCSCAPWLVWSGSESTAQHSTAVSAAPNVWASGPTRMYCSLFPLGLCLRVSLPRCVLQPWVVMQQGFVGAASQHAARTTVPQPPL
jgi:hypothetical protein